MSREIVTVGNIHMANETMYCPNCGVQINYEAFPPNYCPKCGSKVEVETDTAPTEYQKEAE